MVWEKAGYDPYQQTFTDTELKDYETAPFVLYLEKSERIWTNPADLSDSISPDGQHAYRPKSAMDSNGAAIVTWEQYDGSYDQIFMSEYR